MIHLDISRRLNIVNTIVTELYPLSRADDSKRRRARVSNKGHRWADRRVSGTREGQLAFYSIRKGRTNTTWAFLTGELSKFKGAGGCAHSRARTSAHALENFVTPICPRFGSKAPNPAFDKACESEKVRIRRGPDGPLRESVQIRTSFAKRSGPVWVRLYF